MKGEYMEGEYMEGVVTSMDDFTVAILREE